MSVMLVGRVQVKAPDLLKAYVAGVRESLKPFSADTVFRGQKTDELSGQETYSTLVLIEFSNREMALEWFKSPAYQALIPLRDSAADVQITLYSQ